MTGRQDRYGNRRRQNGDHDIGDSSPGTVGDSEGTYHDRARKNSNVIVDGKVQNHESHKRTKKEETTATSKTAQNNTTTTTNQSELDGSVVEVTVDRISGSGNAIANHNGNTIHVEDGAPGETHRVELTSKAGYLLGKRIRLNE